MSDSFNNAEDRPVVAADSGETIGKVHGYVVDFKGPTVVAVHIGGKGDKAEFVSWSDLNAFGNDAVMIPSTSVVHAAADDYEKAVSKGDVRMTKSRVLNTAGFELGKVENVEFETETGKITAVSTTDGTIVADRLISLGSYALMVDPE